MLRLLQLELVLPLVKAVDSTRFQDAALHELLQFAAGMDSVDKSLLVEFFSFDPPEGRQTHQLALDFQLIDFGNDFSHFLAAIPTRGSLFLGFGSCDRIVAEVIVDGKSSHSQFRLVLYESGRAGFREVVGSGGHLFLLTFIVRVIIISERAISEMRLDSET